MKVLIVDDHEVIAEGFTRVVQDACGAQDCQVTQTIEQARAVCDAQHFDLMLLDMNLPDGNGADLVAAFKEKNAHGKIIVVSGDLNASVLASLQALGVDGVYDKGDASSELVSIVNAVLNEQDGSRSSNVHAIAAASEGFGLSRRQLQVLSYLGEGLTNKEISYRQSLSQATVAFHVAELKKKLGCKTSREITLRARELGLLS